jgi:apoptosis-inducing factor 3
MDPTVDFRAIVWAMGDAVIGADRDGAIRLWNPAAERMFGFTADEALGRSLDLIIPERFRDRHWERYQQVMRTGQTKYGAEVLRVPALHKDKRTLSIAFTVALLCSRDNEIQMIVAIVRDETARWKEDRALRQRLTELEAAIQMKTSPADTDDRPNLSKDYLAGTVQEEQLPLHPRAYYEERKVGLVRGGQVTALDLDRKHLTFDDGTTREFGAIILATGADPVRLTMPGEPGPPVHYLRSLADSRAIIRSTEGARRTVVLGASFIGLEVAASLRARKIEVHVVAPARRPLERVLGPELGDFIRSLHEQHGVVFHLGGKASGLTRGGVVLEGGERLDADFIVAGIGVRPATALAEQAGLRVEKGIVVDAYLETATKGVFAVGDTARWPNARGGGLVRIEHWVLAQRQGQAVARTIVGERTPFTDVPFFWSQHYDISINYVGHAERWEAIEIDGSLEQHDGSVRYRTGGRVLAVASIFRDWESLEAELAMEQEAWP